jgi:hypothetical protein
MAIGLNQQSRISKMPKFIFITSFIFAIAGGIIANKILGYGRPFVVLSFLGITAIGQVLMGWELFKDKQQK